MTKVRSVSPADTRRVVTKAVKQSQANRVLRLTQGQRRAIVNDVKPKPKES